ncbi:hypothetical protein BKH46_02335 [Helicobacter sp. 12S02634-8]|uniref:hypothetical protein n=1 Tax=Helicobacter sp. 12S02634-8 TaxID=1476199 RepID=UPI000BA7AA89|nr:hypothetical protein [Helicobacter sp. 12S02634-8]PAF48165.1 hypothetical protein BKH46_02335 [Helicobacter sp. 12S02634-8]
MHITDQYTQLSNKYCLENIKFLVANDLNFCILCDLESVGFEPLLPREIFAKFGPFVLFVLAGYTLESLEVFGDKITFEAGFGSDNIASVVAVRLEGIIQIAIKDKKGDDAVLFHRCDIAQIFGNPIKEAMQDSIEAILSNPRNQETIKTLKKNEKNKNN